MQQIGRYQILEEIGRGAMGVVYRAMDPSIGRIVAIKTFRISDVADKNERLRMRDRIMREAQSAGVLSHPNIVTIYDMAEEGDLAYIAMEFVDGPTLDRQLQDSPPDQKRIFEILNQTAAALDYAHKRGIVHRDIKPANIMLQEGSTVKIADFGVAKIQSQQATHSGTIMGTPNYMSPEQIQGHAVDGRADQFSLAVIVYELLTGDKPFSAESMPTLLFKIVREDPTPPQRINPTLGWPVETVLKRAMSKDPAERYQTCSDFIKALENACASSKGWKPLAPGKSHDMPTVMEPRGPSVAPVPPPQSASPNAPTRPMGAASKTGGGVAVAEPPAALPEPPRERVPAMLRFARALAVVIVTGGILSVLLVAGYRYFGDKDSDNPVPVAPTVDEGEAKPKPSSMPVAASQQQPPPVEPPKTETQKAEVAPPADNPKQQPDEPAETSKENRREPTKEKRADSNLPVPARLVTIPPGATLVVDGRSDMACTTPCSLTLAPGRHTLSASLTGHRTSLKIFELPRDSELYINLENTTGTLVLRSDPPGAAISIDGQSRSERTPVTLTLATGQHHIELSKDGFRTYTEDLEIKDSTITHVDVNWNSKRGSL